MGFLPRGLANATAAAQRLWRRGAEVFFLCGVFTQAFFARCAVRGGASLPINLRQWPPLVTHFLVATIAVVITVRSMSGPTSAVELREDELVWRLPQKLANHFPDKSGKLRLLTRDGRAAWCQASSSTAHFVRERGEAYLLLPATGASVVWFRINHDKRSAAWRVTSLDEHVASCALPRVVYEGR